MAVELEKLNSGMKGSPLHRWLNCTIESFDNVSGALEVVLPDRPELHREENEPYAHGGVIAAMVDLSAHAALRAHYGYPVPTIDLRVDYLRLAALPLRSKAMPRRAGSNVGTVDVEVTGSDGKLAAIGRAVFFTKSPA